jgi:hypothetical protein
MPAFECAAIDRIFGEDRRKIFSFSRFYKEAMKDKA